MPLTSDPAKVAQVVLRLAAGDQLPAHLLLGSDAVKHAGCKTIVHTVIGGSGGLGTTAFHGRQKITLNSGLEMLIRITGR